MHIVVYKNLSPEVKLAPLNQVTRLLLEHGVLVSDGDELLIAEALCVRDIRKVRVSLLTVFTDN